MLTAGILVSRIANGWNVQVIRDGSERIIRFLDRNQVAQEQHRLPVEVYEAVMQDALRELAAGHPKRFQVETNIDFYGNVWAEVRSGLFGINMSVLRISPRHIAQLDALIGDRTRQSAVAAA